MLILLSQWPPNWGPGGHGAIAREPWAHIEKIYIFQGLILKYGLFEFLDFFTH